MKTRIITAALAMTTVMAFAQRKEIRNAEDAVEDGKYAEAKALISQAEPLLSGAKDKDIEKFYLNKGLAYLGTGENVSMEDLMIASEAFKKAKELGVEEAPQGILDVRNAMVNSAIQDEAAEDYGSAYKKLVDAYELHKQDTMYLYFAANYAYNAKDFDKALEYYQELRDLGYTGIETQYMAKNVETGEVATFSTKSERDIFVKSGEYTEPEDAKTQSKVGEMAKTIASIYIQQKEVDKALEAIETAKAENPDDNSILLNEAYIYYELGELEKYQEIIKSVLAKDPNNAVLYYNLGVAAGQMEQLDQAIEYYKKAIELDPEYADSYVNLAYSFLDKRIPIHEEMNSLGMSAADNKKYEELKVKLQGIYEEAVVYLEQAFEVKPSVQTAELLRDSYRSLNNTEKVEEMEQKIAELKAAGGQ